MPCDAEGGEAGGGEQEKDEGEDRDGREDRDDREDEVGETGEDGDGRKADVCLSVTAELERVPEETKKLKRDTTWTERREKVKEDKAGGRRGR